MQEAKKIVIIGGGACGPKTAARARRLDPNAIITIIQDEALVSYAACGMPYFVEGLVKARTELIVRNAAAFKKINNIDVLLETRVDRIDRVAHKVHITKISDGTSGIIDYDKLVIATGARPVVPPLDGINLKMGSGTLTYAATGLAGTKSWHAVFEKRSPFYTTDWNQIPEVL